MSLLEARTCVHQHLVQLQLQVINNRCGTIFPQNLSKLHTLKNSRTIFHPLRSIFSWDILGNLGDSEHNVIFSLDAANREERKLIVIFVL